MRVVALYGNSLVLASIGERIARYTELQPVTIDAAEPCAIEKLSALQPDVILLDLLTTSPDSVMAIWRAHPEVELIGLDLGADRMLVLSGQPARALTAEDLMRTLSARTQGVAE